MALVSMRQLLDHAAENGYGVPAFNVNTLEQVQAIMAAASEVGAPVIMQASAGARKYAGEHFLRHLISAAVEAYPDIPVCMHQDHGQSPSVCQGAIRMGFTSVMIDASSKSFEENIALTKKVVEYAHDHGVVGEAELGTLAGGEDEVAVEHGKESYTHTEEVAEFVSRTG